MSYLTTANKAFQRIAPGEASTGPQVGFLEGIQRSWNYGRAVESELGVKVLLQEKENENFQRIPPEDRGKVERLYGSERVAGIYSVTGYADAREVSRAIGTPRPRDDPTGTDTFADNNAYRALVGNRDAKLRELQKKYPNAGIQTYVEMNQSVKDGYQKMKAGMERDYTFGGNVGWFVGGIASAVDPTVNPLGAATLPVGGAGKTVAGRILSQSGAQGAIQAVEEVTGVRANKRLLGEDPSLGESAANVAFATIGGGVLQSVGELPGGLVRMARRRWFPDKPGDPAPPPPEPPVPRAGEPVEASLDGMPAILREAEDRITRAVQETVGTSRASRRGAETDYAHVAQSLESWSGPRPWEITPPTASRLYEPGEYAPPSVPRLGGESLDDIARRIDPDTFRVYDKLVAQRLHGPLADDAPIFPQSSVSEGGVPTRVFHGTSRAFTNFKRKFSGTRGLMDDGFYFTDDPNIASMYAKWDWDEAKGRPSGMMGALGLSRKAPNIRPAYLDIRNPYIMTTGNRLTLNQIKKLGHDGIKVVEDGAPTTWIAFKASQIKSTFEPRAVSKLDELKPAIERAYARAQNEWDVQDAQRAQIDEMVSNGDAVLPPAKTTDIVDRTEALTAEQVSDLVPELRTPGLVTKVGEDGADAVRRVIDEEAKIMDDVIADLRATAPRLLELRGDEAVMDVAGTEYKLSLADEIVVETDTGMKTTTIREMLKDLDEDNFIEQAVTTCSLGKSIVTA